MNTYYSSKKTLFFIALISDLRLYFLILLFPLGLLVMLCIALNINYGLQKALEAFNFYIFNILFLDFVITSIFSKVIRVLCNFIRPNYIIDNASLKIFPRTIKIFTDIPYKQIDVNKIKYIWEINNIADRHSTNKTYILGIDTNKTSLQIKNKQTRFFSKIFKIANESLSYELILSINNGAQFIEMLPNAKLQNQSLFENILFYGSLI